MIYSTWEASSNVSNRFSFINLLIIGSKLYHFVSRISCYSFVWVVWIFMKLPLSFDTLYSYYFALSNVMYFTSIIKDVGLPSSTTSSLISVLSVLYYYCLPLIDYNEWVLLYSKLWYTNIFIQIISSITNYG